MNNRPTMTSKEAYAKPEFYVDFDHNEDCFCVFGNNSGFAYASYHEKPDADAYCVIMNEQVGLKSYIKITTTTANEIVEVLDVMRRNGDLTITDLLRLVNALKNGEE